MTRLFGKKTPSFFETKTTKFRDFWGDTKKNLQISLIKTLNISINNKSGHNNSISFYSFLPSLKILYIKIIKFQKRSLPPPTKPTKKIIVDDATKPTDDQATRNWKAFNKYLTQQNITYKMRRAKG